MQRSEHCTGALSLNHEDTGVAGAAMNAPAVVVDAVSLAYTVMYPRPEATGQLVSALPSLPLRRPEGTTVIGENIWRGEVVLGRVSDVVVKRPGQSSSSLLYESLW
ncbi:unnamed protein product [Gadus morhua 'NCC']